MTDQMRVSGAAHVLAAEDDITERQRALEQAAAECDRHAEFLKKEAHAGGDWEHLMARYHEATYNAERIRRLKVLS